MSSIHSSLEDDAARRGEPGARLHCRGQPHKRDDPSVERLLAGIVGCSETAWSLPHPPLEDVAQHRARRAWRLPAGLRTRGSSYWPSLPSSKGASASDGGRRHLPLRGQFRIFTGFPLATLAIERTVSAACLQSRAPGVNTNRQSRRRRRLTAHADSRRLAKPAHGDSKVPE